MMERDEIVAARENAGPRPKLRKRPRFKGVSSHERFWQASAYVGNGKKIYIGRFNTEEEAARVRNAWDHNISQYLIYVHSVSAKLAATPAIPVTEAGGYKLVP